MRPTTIAVLSFLSSPAAAQVLDFERVDHASGDAPRAVAAADFDLDGRPDLAVASGGSARVLVLLGTGGGAFAPPAVVGASGPDPRALLAADLDGDSLPDLAAASFGAGQVRVLRNAGGGTFTALPAAPVLPMPRWLAASDLDLDGDLDLASPHQGQTSISVLPANGDATFAAVIPVSLSGFSSGRHLAAADLDVDGVPDLAVGVSGSFSYISLMGTGSGLSWSTVFSPLTLGSAAWVSAGPIDGDALPDLVITADDLGDDEAALFLGSGGGAVHSAPSEYYGCCWHQVHELADLDGDTRLDLLLAHSETSGSQPARLTARRGNGSGLVPSSSAQLPSAATDLAIADLDLDGSLDVAVACEGADEIAVFLQRQPLAPSIASTSPGAVFSLASGGQSLVLQGAGFTTFQSWTLDGATMSGGVVLGDTEIALPLFGPAVGNAAASAIAVGITTSVGTTSVSVPLLPPGAPLLVTNGVAFSKTYAPAEVYRGAGPGDLTFLAAAPDQNPSSIPGLVDLEIGSQFQTLVYLGSKTLPAAGWALDSVPLGNLPVGFPLHFQLAVLPAGGSLPLLSSGVLSGAVAF